MTRLLFITILMAFGAAALAAKSPDDTIRTSQGELKIAFIGHGSLMMTWGGKIVHIDPVSAEADYGKLPKADLVLITHDHYDHLDPKALAVVRKPGTVIVASKVCAGKVPGAVILGNGESTTALGLKIEAVPAYNIVHKRPGDGPFHPKGDGNGYVVTFGDKRIYIGGDTENTPEVKALKNIDVAFLPMNLPYTMTPEMVADAAKAFRPKVLYPYHFGETDTAQLVKLLQGEKGIEVRIRDMK